MLLQVPPCITSFSEVSWRGWSLLARCPLARTAQLSVQRDVPPGYAAPWAHSQAYLPVARLLQRPNPPPTHPPTYPPTPPPPPPPLPAPQLTLLDLSFNSLRTIRPGEYLKRLVVRPRRAGDDRWKAAGRGPNGLWKAACGGANGLRKAAGGVGTTAGRPQELGCAAVVLQLKDGCSRMGSASRPWGLGWWWAQVTPGFASRPLHEECPGHESGRKLFDSKNNHVGRLGS